MAGSLFGFGPAGRTILTGNSLGLADYVAPAPPNALATTLLTGALTYSQNFLSGPPPFAPSLLSSALTNPSPNSFVWAYVRKRFTQFLVNLTLTDQQLEAGKMSQAKVRASLNRHYWGLSSETANSLLIGSWAKHTRIRPPRDIDILFLLPNSIFWNYEMRVGNRQSQLLSEVKDALLSIYPNTKLRQDGQVVIVPFDKMPIEISIGFRCSNNSIMVCNTNNGGSYITSTAEAEVADINAWDVLFKGNVRALIRMMKTWQREKNVALKSFVLERLAVEFMKEWSYHNNDVFYYDWMVRDFFAYLLRRGGGLVVMPVTGEIVPLGDDWMSPATTAYRYAMQACEYERDSYESLAGEEWQKIFGSAVPQFVS
ncbi:MAG TPA: hypothetical protein VJR47_23105 [Stellaceae bacterium]|nr:hypothetical protein [Stellaceae bacterium]